jgi:hypothetical protein
MVLRSHIDSPERKSDVVSFFLLRDMKEAKLEVQDHRSIYSLLIKTFMKQSKRANISKSFPSLSSLFRPIILRERKRFGASCLSVPLTPRYAENQMRKKGIRNSGHPHSPIMMQWYQCFAEKRKKREEGGKTTHHRDLKTPFHPPLFVHDAGARQKDLQCLVWRHCREKRRRKRLVHQFLENTLFIFDRNAFSLFCSRGSCSYCCIFQSMYFGNVSRSTIR